MGFLLFLNLFKILKIFPVLTLNTVNTDINIMHVNESSLESLIIFNNFGPDAKKLEND